MASSATSSHSCDSVIVSHYCFTFSCSRFIAPRLINSNNFPQMGTHSGHEEREIYTFSLLKCIFFLLSMAGWAHRSASAPSVRWCPHHESSVVGIPIHRQSSTEHALSPSKASTSRPDRHQRKSPFSNGVWSSIG
jgi:hypothetical protein